MSGVVVSLHRYPVKGFTPERLSSIDLQTDGFFPCDRLYAVENGASGFDPASPRYIPKIRFTALATLPKVARVRTAYDERTSVLSVEADGFSGIRAPLGEEAGRRAFAGWLTDFIGEEAWGPLKVLSAPVAGGREHRFTDHPQGSVSLINLESLRDLERRTGRRIDPLRFRANLYVEGWPAWSELEHGEGALVRLGGVTFRLFKATVRCAVIHVDPITGERDFDLTAALREHYGHLFCGLYLHVAQGGRINEGDRARLG